MKQLHAVLINVEFCGAAGLSIEFVIRDITGSNLFHFIYCKFYKEACQIEVVNNCNWCSSFEHSICNQEFVFKRPLNQIGFLAVLLSWSFQYG